jgi:hypothetical protein
MIVNVHPVHYSEAPVVKGEVGVLECSPHTIVDGVDHDFGRCIPELLIRIGVLLDDASLEQDVLNFLTVEFRSVVCA